MTVILMNALIKRGDNMTPEEFVNDVLYNDRVFKKNVLNHTWLSGSSTIVYPVTIWEGDCIEIQWRGNENRYQKWIDRMVAKSQGIVKRGVYLKTDGYCPSMITFKLNKDKS